jgi:tetratricopeptide (TPR) repeat protein
MQDEIVSRLANALNAQLIAAEARRAERSLQPSSLDLYFRGMASWNRSWTPEHMRQARDHFERAIELDPKNIDAQVGIAAIDAASGAYLIVDDADFRLKLAETALARVLSLAPEHALAHMFLGAVQINSGRPTLGLAACEHALSLNPNLADAHGTIGVGKMLIGRAIDTEAHVQEALRLSPLDAGAHRWMSYVALSKLHLEAEAEAVMWFRRSVKANAIFLGLFSDSPLPVRFAASWMRPELPPKRALLLIPASRFDVLRPPLPEPPLFAATRSSKPYLSA